MKFPGTDGSENPKAKNTRNTKQPDKYTATEFFIIIPARYGNKPFKVMLWQVGVVRDPRYKGMITCRSEKLIDNLCAMIILLANNFEISHKPCKIVLNHQILHIIKAVDIEMNLYYN